MTLSREMSPVREQDGNCVAAINEIHDVLLAINSHTEDFDKALEAYVELPPSS